MLLYAATVLCVFPTSGIAVEYNIDHWKQDIILFYNIE